MMYGLAGKARVIYDHCKIYLRQVAMRETNESTRHFEISSGSGANPTSSEYSYMCPYMYAHLQKNQALFHCLDNGNDYIQKLQLSIAQ